MTLLLNISVFHHIQVLTCIPF